MSEYKCIECDKEFNSKEAFEMHNNSKHYKSPKITAKGKKKIKNWGIFLVIIAVVVLIGYWMTLQSNAPGKYDEFAQCLNDSRVTMFGAFWCPHCQQQKEAFGNSFKLINYVECSNSDRSQNTLCDSENIDGYPTWEFADGTRRGGFIPLETLADLSGCSLTGQNLNSSSS